MNEIIYRSEIGMVEQTQTNNQTQTKDHQTQNLLSPIKASSVRIETATLVRVTLRLETCPQILLLTDRPSIPSTCHHNPHNLLR